MLRKYSIYFAMFFHVRVQLETESAFGDSVIYKNNEINTNHLLTVIKRNFPLYMLQL